MITKNVKTRRDYLKQHSAAQGELNRHRQAEVTSELYHVSSVTSFAKSLHSKPIIINLK